MLLQHVIVVTILLQHVIVVTILLHQIYIGCNGFVKRCNYETIQIFVVTMIEKQRNLPGLCCRQPALGPISSEFAPRQNDYVGDEFTRSLQDPLINSHLSPIEERELDVLQLCRLCTPPQDCVDLKCSFV